MGARRWTRRIRKVAHVAPRRVFRCRACRPPAYPDHRRRIGCGWDRAFTWASKLLALAGLLGGVGPGVSPATALAVGLKVDVDALPSTVIHELKAGTIDLSDPAVTVSLLKLNAVVGVTGHLNADGSLSSMGLQCSLCHSTVDNSFAYGIGHRLDGFANRDLNVGAIVSLAPNLQPVAGSRNQGFATAIARKKYGGEIDVRFGSTLDARGGPLESRVQAPGIGTSGCGIQCF